MSHSRVTFFAAAFLLFCFSLMAHDWLGYVADGNAKTVTPINLTTQKPLATILVGAIPFGIAITPDNKTLYVVNHGSNTVTPIDVASHTPYAPLAVGPRPTFLAISPSSHSKAYVINSGNNTITPIDTRTNTVLSPIPVGPSPSCIAIHPNGSKAYVANNGDNTITVVDLETETVLETCVAGTAVYSMAFSPDGSILYLTNKALNSVTPIDTITHTAAHAIPVGRSPAGIAITPDGKKAYVANSGENSVTPIALDTHTTSLPIPVGKSPYCLAITPDGQTVYVSNTADNTVTPIDTTTDKAGTPIQSGKGPVAIAITPDQAPVALFKQPLPSTVDLPVLFDASPSFSKTGTIAQYAWDFGDGKIAILTSPQVEHTYTSHGTFLVTLAVTNSAGTSFFSDTFTGQTMSQTASRAALDARYVLIQPPPRLERISSFTGKVASYTKSHKVRWKLIMAWKPSISPRVDHYDIFRSHVLIATIACNSLLTYSFELELPSSYNKKIPSKVLERIAKEFFIQAVAKTGEKSEITILKMHN